MAIRKSKPLAGSISTSEKMYDKRMGVDARLLFTFMIAHQDDEGRLNGNPNNVKIAIVPGESWTISYISELLLALKRSKLIAWYGQSGKKVVQILKTENFQNFHGIKKIPSQYPSPPHQERCLGTPGMVSKVKVSKGKVSKGKLREGKLREEVIAPVLKVVDKFPIYGTVEPKDLADIINEFPSINPVTLFNDLYAWESSEDRNTKKPLTRIRNFFKTASKDKSTKSGNNNAEILGRYE